jgi:hypothetical protein
MFSGLKILKATALHTKYSFASKGANPKIHSSGDLAVTLGDGKPNWKMEKLMEA